MSKFKRAALYARASAHDGACGSSDQLHTLREVAVQAGWMIAETYVDFSTIGADEGGRNPALNRLLLDATHQKFDLVAAWSVDRLGRSLQELVAFLNDLNAAGCALYLHVQAIDTTTSAGKSLFQTLNVFAEFERAIVQDRIHDGLAKARAKGQKLGRPTVSAKIIAAVRARAAAGEGKRAIGRALGVPESTVRKILSVPLEL